MSENLSRKFSASFLDEISSFEKRYVTWWEKGTITWPLNWLRTLEVWPDWVIYCTLGNFLKLVVATIILPKSHTFLRNFVKVSKTFILVKYFLGNINRHLVTFYCSHWTPIMFCFASGCKTWDVAYSAKQKINNYRVRWQRLSMSGLGTIWVSHCRFAQMNSKTKRCKLQ